MYNRMMTERNRSADVFQQARASVAKIARLEAIRRGQFAAGNHYAAGITLSGMSAAFADAPSVEEMQNALKAAMPDSGDLVSGQAYHNQILNRGLATYSVTSKTPEKLDAYVKRSLARSPIPKFVQGSVQSAAYYYANDTARSVGSGLGVLMEMGTAEKAWREYRARQKAHYLTALAGLGLDISIINKARAGSKQYKSGSSSGVTTDYTQISQGGMGEYVKQAQDIIAQIDKWEKEGGADHVYYWLEKALWGWGWASKKDVVGVWCNLPIDVRNRQAGSYKYIEAAFQKKASNSGWAWDADWNCRGGSGGSGSSGSGGSGGGSGGGSSGGGIGDMVTGSNMPLVLGAIGLGAIVLLSLRK